MVGQETDSEACMTATTFFVQFERSLRVGEPKRAEIIAELRTHFDEHGSDPATLGDPKRLAQQYNRTHVGILGEQPYLHLTPIVTLLAIFFIHAIRLSLWQHGILNSYVESNEIVAFEFWITLCVPFVVAFFVGRALIRTYRPIADFFGLIISSFTFGILFGVLYNIIAGPEPFYGPNTIRDMFSVSAFQTGIVSLFALVSMTIGMLITAPLHQQPRVRLKQLKTQLWVITPLGLLASWLTFIGFGITRSWLNIFTLVTGATTLFFIARVWRQRWHEARLLARQG